MKIQNFLLRLTLAFLVSLLFSSHLLGQVTHRKLDGFCELGNRSVAVIGATSTTKVQGSFPSCTVTVFIAGTATPAAICSDNSGPTCTPKTNPFTADSNGYWAFFAASAQYDVQFTGGTSPNTFPAPFTRAGLMVPSPFTGATAVTNNGLSTDNAIARFDGATGLIIQNSTVILGDTGNVTGLGTLNTHTIPGGTDTFTLNAASQTLTNKLFVSPSNVLGGVGVAIGGDATGDVWYRNSGGIFTRLPIGSAGQVLTVSGGLPIWQTGSFPPFSDNTSIVAGSVDSTKLLRFEVDGFTTATTRILTPPDASITLAGTNFLNAWADGVKQTFNPDGTNAGINVGQHTTDPSSPTNGDCYYNSVANEFRCRINSTWIALSGGGGGGGSPGGSNGNFQYRVNASTFGGLTGSVATSLGEMTISPVSRSSPALTFGFAVLGNQDTNQTADTEVVFGSFDSPDRQYVAGGGTFTSQREWIFTQPTYSFTSADTIVTAATLAIGGPPIPGTNATITNSYALWIQTGTILLGTPNSTVGALRFAAASDADTTTIQSGDTPASSITYKWPADDPVANDVLKVTSFGSNIAVLEWAVGGGGSSPPFTDNTSIVEGSVDPTKEIRFEVDGLTTGTVRVITPPDTSFGMAGNNIVQTFSREQSFVPISRTGTQTFYFRIQTPNDVALTADTESLGVILNGSSTAGTITREWTAAGGTFTTQREVVVAQITYAFTSADTLTNAASFAIIGAPIAGTNATLTNRYALWVQADDSRFDGRIAVNTASAGAQLHVLSAADATVAGIIAGTSTATADLLRVRRSATSVFIIGARGQILAVPSAQTGGSPTDILFTSPNHLDLANAEFNSIFLDYAGTSFNFVGGGGTIASERVIRITTPQLNADAAQTITTAATLSIQGGPAAGTNITITNRYTAWFETGTVLFGEPSVATGAIRFAVSGDADTITLKGGDTPDATLEYKWPTVSPTASQVLSASAPSGGIVTLSWATGGGGGGNCTVAGSQGDYQINSGASGCAAGVITQGTNGRVIGSPTLTSSGALSYFRIVTPADTSQTADTEMLGIIIGGSSASPPATVTRQGADGTTYALQREVIVTGATYGFVGATTVSDVITMDVGMPIQGTNATFTRIGALGFNMATNKNAMLVRNDDFAAGNGSYYIFTRDSGGQDRFRLSRGEISCFESACQYNNRFGSGNLSFGTGGVTDRIVFDSAGLAGFNKATSIGAQVHIVSGATGRIGLLVDSATNSTVDLLQYNLNADDTSTVANLATFGANSNGTAAAGFGQGITFNLESSTTNDQAAGRIQTKWLVATHASRQSSIHIATVDAGTTTFKDRISIVGDSSFSTVYLGNGISAGATIIANLQATDGTGTNIGGSRLNINGGLSTGTGAPGQVTFQYSTQSTASGSAVNVVDPGVYRLAPTEFTQTSTVTVANTVTETTLIGTIPNGDNVIGAGVMNPGRSVTWEVWGTVAVTGTPNLTIKFKIGSTTVSTQTFTALPTTTTSRLRCTFVATGRTFSATGTVFVQGDCRVANEAGTPAGLNFNATGVNTATSTIDWTANQTLDLTATWGTASASNTISITNIIAHWNN